MNEMKDINEIKDFLTDNIGGSFKITVDCDKKSQKTMECVLKETYSSIFLVDVINEPVQCQKTFTYTEVHCKEILIEKI
ncbi:MAG: Veg family protein [Bacilli bacterium]